MTDVAFAICMIVYALVVLGICIYGLAKGEPFQIIAPINGYRVMCGYGEASSTPYKFFPI